MTLKNKTMKSIKHLRYIPLAILSMSTFGQKPATEVVFAAPFYTLSNADFQKLWDQATVPNRTRVVGQLASQKSYSFIRGDKIYIFMEAPKPGFDFEGLAYRYTIYDQYQKQVGTPSSVQVVGVRDWIGGRGRMPANMNLPMAWYGHQGRGSYLKVEFVQNGNRFITDFFRP